MGLVSSRPQGCFMTAVNSWYWRHQQNIHYKKAAAAATAANLLQSCLTLCNLIDGSPPGSSVPGILQARVLDWVAIAFSNAWKWKVKVKSLSRARLLVTPWTAAPQAPLSMGFSRQEDWRGAPSPSPRRHKKEWNSRCWQRCGGNFSGVVGRDWEILSPLWETSCQLLIKLNIYLTY